MCSLDSDIYRRISVQCPLCAATSVATIAPCKKTSNYYINTILLNIDAVPKMKFTIVFIHKISSFLTFPSDFWPMLCLLPTSCQTPHNFQVLRAGGHWSPWIPQAKLSRLATVPFWCYRCELACQRLGGWESLASQPVYAELESANDSYSFLFGAYPKAEFRRQITGLKCKR